MSEVNLLVVGSSEVRMFWEGRQYLQQEYGIRVRVDYQAGAVLEESLGQIKRSMKPNTQILIIWALTPYAWKRTPIRTKNKWDTTIFRPSKFLSIENVPGLMNRIMRYVLQVNPYCSVYLSIPAIKDMYCFNESRLVKAWGENYRDYLLHHAEYNPEQMRTSSVRAYSLFCSLKKPHYHWEEKQLLFGGSALNCYASRIPNKGRGREQRHQAAHTKYLKGYSSRLDSTLIPDGLHGNQEFLHFYMLSNRRILDSFNPIQRNYQLHEKRQHPHSLKSSSKKGPRPLMQIDTSNFVPPVASTTRNNNDNELTAENQYRFGDLSQPSTSHEGRIPTAPQPYDFIPCNYPALITPTQQHGYTLYPHVSPFDIYSHNTNPFLLPSTFPSSCSHHMINPDAQAWVREYMNDRKRKGHERKLKRLHDLEELSLAIDQEKEITKRLRR
ncbi:UNVERIFIED_CONTAM: hypothetical protein RMT77_002847 [Armadillidium vulgare]